MRKHGSAPRRFRRGARPRRGISLMEVLISAFIMAVGLLGVAALLPVGHHEANSGTISDRSSLIAKQAFRDFRIRGYVPGHADTNPLMYAPGQTDVNNTYPRYRSVDDPRFTWLVVASREPYNTSALVSTDIDWGRNKFALNYVPPEKAHGGNRVDNPGGHSLVRVIVYVFYSEDADKGLFNPGASAADIRKCPATNRPVAVFEKVVRVEGTSMWKWD